MATVEADPYPWPYNGDLRPISIRFADIALEAQDVGGRRPPHPPL